MEDSNDILAKYREADFHDRLNLYLLYPQLRRDFLTIERTDKALLNTRQNNKETWPLKRFLMFPCTHIFTRIGRRLILPLV